MPIARVLERTLKCRDSGSHMATTCCAALRFLASPIRLQRIGGQSSSGPADRTIRRLDFLGSMPSLIATAWASSTDSFNVVIGSFPNLSGFVDQAVCVYCLVRLPGPTLNLVSHFVIPHLPPHSNSYILCGCPFLSSFLLSISFHEHF